MKSTKSTDLLTPEAGVTEDKSDIILDKSANAEDEVSKAKLPKEATDRLARIDEHLKGARSHLNALMKIDDDRKKSDPTDNIKDDDADDNEEEKKSFIPDESEELKKTISDLTDEISKLKADIEAVKKLPLAPKGIAITAQKSTNENEELSKDLSNPDLSFKEIYKKYRKVA